ncbi:MAG: class I SAM-dependent methyltransferase [Candidatus Bathyarchaeota archaeon]|nr:MAG: class I SAM-dependent methyltransferase [Candidatus Bathyarchaeota archaeon]
MGEKDNVENMVKNWFTETAQVEWRRLGRDPYHNIEFTVTTHFLERFLPKRGLVLDAGGGPGRYTIELAKKGYRITLLDLVPEMLKLARRRIRRAGVSRKVDKIVQGSIEDLSCFSDETFDAVLCLGGPLCHLLNIEQREEAASELLRVAKKGAPLFISVISRLGLLITLLTQFPHEIQYAMHHWEVGDYVPGKQGEGFTAAHWFLPEELQTLFENKGAEKITFAGLEGLSSHHRKETNRLYKDSESGKIWTEILLRTCTHPSVVGISEHFLLVCRKATRERPNLC